MIQYQMLLQDILNNGELRKDRTGVGTIAVFGRTLEVDLAAGFPLLTTKKLPFLSIAAELTGFLNAVESAKDMRFFGTKIWDANANSPYWQEAPACRGKDDIGRIYGVQWRKWSTRGNTKTIDQLGEITQRLISNPTDRRLIVTAWRPDELDQMCLPPCHIFFQFYVREGKYLDCQWYIRSVDSFLGMPFDIASYALLTHIVAQQVDLAPGRLKMVSGDTHIYLNHLEQVKEVLQRSPRTLPTLDLFENANIDNFLPVFANLEGYDPHPAIKAEMAL